MGQLLKETGVQDIWVEYHPRFFQGDPSLFLQRLRELSENHRCFPITGDMDLLAAIIKDNLGHRAHRPERMRGRRIRER